MNFRAIFALESSRYFSKRNILLFLSILLISGYFVFNGIRDYNRTLKNSKEFQQCQLKFVSTLKTYLQLSSFGVKFMFVPSAAGIICANPPGLSELGGRVDSTIILDINNNCKGKSIFVWYIFDHSKFSGIILLGGSLLALFLGYGTLRSNHYMRYLSSFLKERTVFWMLTLTRFILLFLTFLAIFGLMIAFVLLSGVQLTGSDWKGLGVFGLSASIMLLFFFLAGLFIGCPHPGNKGKLSLLVTWFIFIFIIPAFFYSILDFTINDLTPSFKLDLDKLKIAMGFEERSEKEKGNFDRKKIIDFKVLAESYWINTYKEVIKQEDKFRNEIKTKIDRFNFVSQINPASFFYLTSIETGSRGYENYLAFYNHLIAMHQKFVRFYIDRCFVSEARPIVVPFIKGDENLFKAKSRVPRFFFLGLIINLGYCFIVGMASWHRFKKLLKGKSSCCSKKSLNENDLTCTGDLKVFHLKKQVVSVKFYNHYKKEDGFLYICHPDHIPGDIFSEDFIRFVSRIFGLSLNDQDEILNTAGVAAIKGKNFRNLKKKEKGELLFSIVCRVKRRCYLVDNVALGMPIEFTKKLKDWMVSTAGSGVQVIYLTSERCPSDSRLDFEGDYNIVDDWPESVDQVKKFAEKRDSLIES